MKSLFLIAPLALVASAACVIEPGSIETPPEAANVVPLRTRYQVACETRSPAGFGAGFHDPRNDGECWACPNSNPIRTWSAVNQADACATRSVAGIGAQVAAAKYLGPYGRCPDGDVQQGGVCLYCPAGSAWNSGHRACVK